MFLFVERQLKKLSQQKYVTNFGPLNLKNCLYESRHGTAKVAAFAMSEFDFLDVPNTEQICWTFQ